jgi:tape measure domain-containing protein
MAENKTTLGIEVKTSGVAQAAADLQKLQGAASSAEKSTASMSSGINAVNAQLAAMAAKARGAGQGFKALDPAAQSAANLARELKETERAARAAALEISKAAKESEGLGGGTSAATIAKGGLAAMAIAKAWEFVAQNIGEAVKAADDYTRVESKLRMVTGGAAGAVEAQAALFKIAQDTRQPFIELANTYAQVARATEDLGLSQSELLNVTKTVSQAVALSGASTQAAQAAMVQFSQAMASGTLRGEELNSIMEQTPRLAQAIAQGMGIGIGELRKLGAQGELTANQVLGAIAKSAKRIDEEFKSMTPTVADGFTKLSNSAGNFIDVINDATGASRALYSVLASLSRAMDFTAKGVKSSVEGAKTGVLEAKVNSLTNQINSLGKDDYRIKGLQAQLASAQADLFKVRGQSLAGGAEAPVLKDDKAKGPSSAYLSLTQKMSGVSQDFYKNLKILNDEYGRTGNLKNYQAEVKKLIETETEIGRDSIKKVRGGGGGSKRGAEASEDAKLYLAAMKSIADAEKSAEKSTLELSAAQGALYDLMASPQWANMPEAWKQTALAQFESARAAELNAKFLKDVQAQEELNIKQRQGMIEQIQAAEKATEMYGLTEAQISVVEQARLADAVAMLEQELAMKSLTGQSDDETESLRAKIGVLKEELALRGKLSDALVSKDRKAQEIEDAKNEVKGATGELDEFTKQAARNMTDAMSEFFINPTKDGMQSIAQSFGETIQKMIAQAAAAQLGNILFGDLTKGKGMGGLVGQGLDWLGGLFASAKGNAFSSGGVHAFASGGAFGNGEILNSPTVFRFASGGSFRTGVAGEAGPEGALPLKRMSNGKLGVYADGGKAMTINQNIVVGQGADKAEVKRAAASGARSALGVMNGARRYG